MMERLSDEELIDLFGRQLPDLLERRPDLEPMIYAVEQRNIAGEQFNVLIFDHQLILVEIAASVGPTILERLERKRRLYTEATGIVPTRTILATASIHSQRAQALRQQGIEVIEPEEIE